jgi:hypothetical protein
VRNAGCGNGRESIANPTPIVHWQQNFVSKFQDREKVMFRIVICVIALLLSACATSLQPMAPKSIEEVKNGKSVVALYDGDEQIRFIENKYLILGVAQVASSSVYRGFWDSNKDISALHAAELSKIGIRSQSLYDVISEVQKPEFIAMQNDMNTQLMKTTKSTGQLNTENKSDLSLVLNPKMREQLLEKGFDYLIWMNWSGYVIHIKALGAPTMESFRTTYWIHDLKQNRTIWSGDIPFGGKVKIEGDSAKAFLEKNNLAGLKREVERMIKEKYDVHLRETRRGAEISKDSVGQIIGLEPKTSSEPATK